MDLRATLIWSALLIPFYSEALIFDRYHSQEEINEYLLDVAAAKPSLVKVHHLGYSDEGRDIYYAIVSKGDADQIPAIYINGTHHGNEKSSTEAVVGLFKYLVESNNQRVVDELLRNYAIYLQPLVNPDGHARGSRADALGRDPNRDYDPANFRTASIKLVKQLTDKVRFRAAAAFHSGMEAILWPWGDTPSRAPDNDIFYTLSRISAEAMGVQRYLQSYYDYPTRGEFIDYVYNNHGTLALTFEISDETEPAASALPQIIRRSTAGAVAFMLSVLELNQGSLTLMSAPTTGNRKAVRLSVTQ